jgi:GNAT superfamily N-acetyltransferase
MGQRPVTADGDRLSLAAANDLKLRGEEDKAMTPRAGDAPLVVTDKPGSEAEAVIRDGLGGYSLEKAGYSDYRPLAVLARDPETDEVVGGLLGRTSFGLLRIDTFFLPERLRRQGLGGRIIKMAEEEGRRRGCSRALLSTLSFQAPEFYRRQGWDELARIECDPPGHTRFLMTKRLTSP